MYPLTRTKDVANVTQVPCGWLSTLEQPDVFHALQKHTLKCNYSQIPVEPALILQPICSTEQALI